MGVLIPNTGDPQAVEERRTLSSTAVRVEDVAFSYGRRELFSRVQFELGYGQSMAISGPTGCGKSTLLSLLTGMVPFRAGRIRVGGIDLGTAKEADRVRFRLHTIGVVRQHSELLGNLSAEENVMAPMLLTGAVRWDDARARAHSLLERFHVAGPETFARALSGGERQRVALARALANSPRIILADEPTASLDPVHRDAIASELFGLASGHGCAVLVVTHDASVAGRADRLAHMADGALEFAYRGSSPI